MGNAFRWLKTLFNRNRSEANPICHDCDQPGTLKYYRPLPWNGPDPKPKTWMLCEKHFEERLQKSADEIIDIFGPFIRCEVIEPQQVTDPIPEPRH